MLTQQKSEVIERIAHFAFQGPELIHMITSQVAGNGAGQCRVSVVDEFHDFLHLIPLPQAQGNTLSSRLDFGVTVDGPPAVGPSLQLSTCMLFWGLLGLCVPAVEGTKPRSSSVSSQANAILSRNNVTLLGLLDFFGAKKSDWLRIFRQQRN